MMMMISKANQPRHCVALVERCGEACASIDQPLHRHDFSWLLLAPPQDRRHGVCLYDMRYRSRSLWK